ncbi:hypothetical protein P692DRAFT_201836748 [Suillus brevipes Sb2]|nr:hypothetical protein P692DRAFT_201836748 [Suillus brevipes Sb2]
MKLTAGSQIFHLNIRQTHNPENERRYTVMNMAITQHAVLDISGKMSSREQVWISIRDRDIPKSIQGFLWKSIHRAYKIGEFWDKIPNYEGRGECGICRLPETMEHILIECNSIAVCTIWQAAKDLWCKRETRLFHILVLESAHLIWKLRCERTIKLKFDRLLTDSKRYGTKALKVETVLKTWSSILLNEDNLPDNWVHNSGVLVGMAPRRPLRRNR